MAVVRPIEIFFCSQFKLPGLKDLKEFLWADYRKGIWDGEHLSDTLKLVTSASKDIPELGYRDYRQVATAFMEKHIKHKVDAETESGDNVLDLQAGHSTATATTRYAVGKTDHRIVTRDMLFAFRIASKAWHKLMYSASLQASIVSGISYCNCANKSVVEENTVQGQGWEFVTEPDVQELSQEITLLKEKMFHFSKTELERAYTMQEGIDDSVRLLTMRFTRTRSIRCIAEWFKAIVQESSSNIQVSRTGTSCDHCVSTKETCSCSSSNWWWQVFTISVANLSGTRLDDSNYASICSTG